MLKYIRFLIVYAGIALWYAEYQCTNKLKTDISNCPKVVRYEILNWVKGVNVTLILMVFFYFTGHIYTIIRWRGKTFIKSNN